MHIWNIILISAIALTVGAAIFTWIVHENDPMSDAVDAGVAALIVGGIAAFVAMCVSLAAWGGTMACSTQAHDMGAADQKYGLNAGCRIDMTGNGEYVPEGDIRFVGEDLR